MLFSMTIHRFVNIQLPLIRGQIKENYQYMKRDFLLCKQKKEIIQLIS